MHSHAKPHLRYLLSITLHDVGAPMTVRELIAVANRAGIELRGRPSKVVSDALHWEIRRGRVRRLERGLYAPGYIPRSTVWWLRQQLHHMRAV